MPIHLLAPDVAAKIAAGEVVERPANVVKELLENSLDAGATEVRVEIREGGQRLLRVTDNGHGIPAEEVPLAFARHATSKLSSADDLNQIMTYGFRGEALYSIAAVSHTTLTTRHRDEPFGSQIQLEGGNVVSQGRAGTPVGTILNVEHLFFNVPARKKFLRKPATEAGQISDVIKRYALAFPDRRFSLVVDGRLLFQSSGSGDLYDVLVKVFGLENARQFVPIGAPLAHGGEAIDEDTLDEDVDFMELAAPPRPIGQPAQSNLAGGGTPSEATVSGYTSLPTLTRANRNSIDLFINRRYVEDRTLTYAVVQAYHTLLQVGRYPIALIFLEVDPAQIDVNVHPQKTQVRLAEERRLFNVVQRAVRRALVHHAPIPDMNLPAQAPAPDAWAPTVDAGWDARGDTIMNAGAQPVLDFYVPQPPPQPISPDEGAIWSPPPNAQPLPPPPASVGPARQPDVTPHTAQLPPLRVVGQVGALYIIAEGPEGLYLIDQHAAHERILYEQFMAQRYGQKQASSREQPRDSAVPQQHLLEPLTLHIGHELTGLVAHHLEELQTVGFSVEPFGGDTFLVRAVPAVLSGQDPLRALEEIVSSLAQQRNQVGEELEARLVKMICKRAAIKAGQLLSPLEMQELVRQLEACQSPRTCPHGRPTMIQLSAGELEKAFGRI
ncbi:MAG: DNA mismatch repair endonuclease MutL [Caldilineaceae bacterium]|nr:DNA mismatch repair endonuclease MutL [Caldilineaceae bacterium]